MAESVISREAGRLTEEYMASYSRYVAQNRAIPSLIDGLKPVQRRILNSANDLHLHHTGRFLKSAKLEGQVLGDYHPHGGASLSGLVQPFKIRYPLLEGQGNWGCPDDPGSVAASRYTEVRLTKFAEDFYLSSADYADREDNYDGRLKEIIQYYPPIPGVLLTGAEGIAIGLTTKIPVHEIGVVCDSLLEYIDNDMDSDACIKCMVPDTCEKSILTSSREDIEKLYRTGEGTLTYQASTHYEREGNLCHLVVDAFPPGFSRKRLQNDSILKYVEDGILTLSNESSTNIRYVFTTDNKDISVLDEVKSLLTSSVSYKMHIENKGVVGLYDLKTLYAQFIEARKEYIVRKYKALKEKDLYESKYIMAFQSMILYDLHHKFMDVSEDEALKMLMSMHPDPDMVPEDIARRILNTPVRNMTKDNADRMSKKLDILEDNIREYDEYIKDPIKKIVMDIKDLKKSYGAKMNSEVASTTKEEITTGYIVEDGKIYLGKNNSAPYDSKYFFLCDDEGFVVVEGDEFRSKGNPNLLKSDHLHQIYGFNDMDTTKILYDDVEVPIGTWSIRHRTSKIICKESKSKRLVGLAVQTSL